MIDYLFYRMYYWNTKVVRDLTPLFSAILCTSIFIGLNIIAIYNFYFFYFENDLSFLSRYIDLSFGILSFVFCFYYFKKNDRYREVLTKYKNISEEEKIKKDIFIVLYIMVTMGSMIWIAIELRKEIIGHL